MVQVRDVESSSRWYQKVMEPTSGHGGPDLETPFDGSDFVLRLHRLDAHGHGILTPSGGQASICGISLWLEVQNRDPVRTPVECAEQVGSSIVAETSWNPLAHHFGSSLVDPVGYIVGIQSPFNADTRAPPLSAHGHRI